MTNEKPIAKGSGRNPPRSACLPETAAEAQMWKEGKHELFKWKLGWYLQGILAY